MIFARNIYDGDYDEIKFSELFNLAKTLNYEWSEKARNKFRSLEDEFFIYNECALIITFDDDLVDDEYNFLNYTTIPLSHYNDSFSLYARRLKRIYKLAKCEICNENEVVFRHALPNGYLNAKCMVIGEAPGISTGEKKFERAWGYGSSSTFLRKTLLFGDYYVWFTNTMKCALKDNEKRSDEPFNNCWKNILFEINTIKPEVIYVLGKNAQNFLKEKIKNFVCVPHPSWAIRKKISCDSYIRKFK